MLNLVISNEDAQTIIDGLGALPLSRSINTFMRVQEQIAQQRQPGAPAVPAGANGRGQSDAEFAPPMPPNGA